MNTRKKHINGKAYLEKHIFACVVIGACILIGFVWTYGISQLESVIETLISEKVVPPGGIKKLPTASSATTFRIPILLYHYVEYVKDPKDTIRQSLNVIPRIFDQQLKTLTDAGYTCITASELADILDGKTMAPPKPILITFDDGHWDLYTDVLPILEKYHVKATAYIISGFIGAPDFLSQKQLQKVIQSGLVEIGAHTVHHIALTQKLRPFVQYEVFQSKASLENTYHIPVVSFAYPDGSYDQQAAEIVQSAGFRTAVSTTPGIAQNQAHKFFLYRLRPGARTGEALLHYLQQIIIKN